MLVGLYIQNIAVINRAEAQFEPGLNVLTGETGAGKSLIIDSINMVIGERTLREMIRTGEDSAAVEAVFYLPPDCIALEGTDIVPEEDGSLILSREIFANGRNICKINGRVAALSQLREAGGRLINIHGQQDNQALLVSEGHLNFVDELAKNGPLLERYRGAHEECGALRRQIRELDLDEAQRIREADILNYQVDEIESAKISAKEEADLQSRRLVLSNASQIREGLEEAARLLSGEMQGVRDLAARACEAIKAAAAHDGALEEYLTRGQDIVYQTEDIAQGLARYMDGLETEPDELAKVEARLDIYYKIKKKYGESVDAVLNFLAGAKEKLSQIKASGENIAALTERLNEKTAERERLAGELSKTRRAAAELLARRVNAQLCELNMAKMLFDVKITPCEFKANGADEVEFFIATGPGEPLRPLSRIASGGEMSRICLALKTALSGADKVPTMVFDEIDTGIGGQAGLKIAKKLRELGRERQILCVTHLPQIAAAADFHFSVEKHEEGGRFITRVKRLDDDEKAREIATMTSGAAPTPVTVKNALEMIANAKKL